MGTEKTNKLKIVLVKQGKTGKWLARQLEKKRGDRFTVMFQCKPAFFGNADENSIHITLMQDD